jgi:superfamily II DNA or RNA helicase
MELEKQMEPRRKLSDYKRLIYSSHHEYFDRWQTDHRQHQIDAIRKIKQDYSVGITTGQVISPCGTGKTRIQISLHIENMICNSEPGVYVIASHRLSLNRQLLGGLIEVAVNCGLSFDVLYIGSYQSALSNYYAKYHHFGYTSKVSRHLASTNYNDIEKFIAEAKDLNRHVIIASTYDSFSSLQNINPINIITFDEAHNTIQKDFTNNISKVKNNIIRQYFFTATRKVAGEIGGMNNKDFYGDILVDISPKEMLDCGEIVPPMLHMIDSETGETASSSNKDMLIKNTIEAFLAHRDMLKEYSSKPKEIGAKLLVGCNSINEMEEIYSALILEPMANDMQMFAISSDRCSVNWINVSKEIFFSKLMDLTDAEDAIIFNVDMLTEGIDLPSITGVMPLRNLGLTKLIQLLGRALRLNQNDRNKLYTGDLDLSQRTKPFGCLVMPRHLSTINEHEQMIETAINFYSYWGTMPDKIVVQEKYCKLQKQILPSMIPYQYQNGKEYQLQHSEMSLIEKIPLYMFRNDMIECKDNSERRKYFERMCNEDTANN